MDVKSGYKLTEVGVIPEDWEVSPLGEIIEYLASGNSRITARSSTYPIYGSTGVIGYSETFEYSGDAILIARVGVNAGRLNLVSGRYGVTDNTIILRLATNQYLPFFWYQLQTKQLNSLVFGSGQPLLTGTQLKKLLVSVPPLVEQQAIASVLDEIGNQISALDDLTVKKRNLKHGTMNALLTGEKRLPSFSDKWNECILSDVGNFSKGAGIRKDQVTSDGFPCVRYGEIYTHHNDHIRSFYSFIPREIAVNSKRLKKGDLLFAGSGETAEEIGKCVAFLGDEECYAGSDIVVFSPHEQNAMFLGYLMNHPSVTSQKAKFGQGDAVVHISARNLGQLELQLPKLEEQDAIAAVISTLDDEIDLLKDQREKIFALRQGMMQELLNGRKRLI